MPICEQTQDRLIDFQYGLCDERESEEIREHLQTCEICQRESVQTDRFRDTIKGAAILELDAIQFVPGPPFEIPATQVRTVVNSGRRIPGYSMLFNPRSPIYRYVYSARLVAVLMVSIVLHILAGVFMLHVGIGDPKEVIDCTVIVTTGPHKRFDESELSIYPLDLSEISDVETVVDLEPPQVPELRDMGLPNSSQTGTESEKSESVRHDPESLNDIETVSVTTDPEPDVEGLDWSPASDYFASSGEQSSRNRAPGLSRTVHIEGAILSGLEFLARQQRKDGSWSSAVDGHDAASVTGLALLAFLSSGHSETSGKYKSVVQNAVSYLASVQAKDGSWMARGMVSHVLCTMAMAEAWRIAGKSSRAQNPVRKGVEWFVTGSPKKRIADRVSGDDGLTLVYWQFMACKSAKLAGLDVPAIAFRQLNQRFKKQMKPNNGRPDVGTTHDRTPPVGLMSCLFFGQVQERKPNTSVKNSSTADTPDGDYEYASLVIYELGRSFWRGRDDSSSNLLLTNQLKSGPAAGSWEVRDHGARDSVYVTAQNILSLAACFRYLPIYDD